MQFLQNLGKWEVEERRGGGLQDMYHKEGELAPCFTTILKMKRTILAASACMCGHHHHEQPGHQPGVNPACCQMNGENELSLSPFAPANLAPRVKFGCSVSYQSVATRDRKSVSYPLAQIHKIALEQGLFGTYFVHGFPLKSTNVLRVEEKTPRKYWYLMQ